MRISVATSAAAVLGLGLQAVAAIDPLVIKDAKWFNSKSGEQFFVKGVDYQPDILKTSKVRDPLVDVDACNRDLPFLKDLGVNAIRVYQTEPFGNHDQCMKMLADAGIYVMLDLSTPTETINRESPSYDVDLLGYYKRKVDTFSKYDNVFAFLAGNEVTNAINNTMASAFVKGALRDVKAYIKSKKLKIPVGYATNDDAEIRWNLQNYFDCGSKEEQADFYGVNLYEWCGDKVNFETSGYVNVVKNFTGWDVPVVLTEYGCNSVKPRTFPQVAALYGSKMTDEFSGGFVYEYVEEANQFGLVKVDGNKGSKTADYDNFKKALAAVNPKGVSMSSYSSNNKPHDCPKVGATTRWMASNKLPPTPSNDTCSCMEKTLTCVSKMTAPPTGDAELAKFGKTVSEIFGTACAKIDCGPVSSNATTGTYGKYSFCDTIQRVNWVMTAYYTNQRQVSGSCDFNGFAHTQSVKSTDDSRCPTQKGSSDSNGSNDPNGSNENGDSDTTSDSTTTMPSTSLFALAIMTIVAMAMI